MKDIKSIYNQIGSKIRETRKSQGLTIEDLSDKVSLDWSFVARIERAKAIPSIATVVKLSDALNIPLEELFHEGISQKDKLLQKEIFFLVRRLNNKEKQTIIKILNLILSLKIKTKNI